MEVRPAGRVGVTVGRRSDWGLVANLGHLIRPEPGEKLWGTSQLY